MPIPSLHPKYTAESVYPRFRPFNSVSGGEGELQGICEKNILKITGNYCINQLQTVPRTFLHDCISHFLSKNLVFASVEYNSLLSHLFE